MGIVSNPKMAFNFPISCILALIFPITIKYFPKCEGQGSFLKSQIESLLQYHKGLLNCRFAHFRFGRQRTDRFDQSHEREGLSEKRERFEETFKRIQASQEEEKERHGNRYRRPDNYRDEELKDFKTSHRRDEASDEGHRGFGMAERGRDEMFDDGHRGFGFNERNNERDTGQRVYGVPERRSEHLDEGHRVFEMSENRGDKIFMESLATQAVQSQENIQSEMRNVVQAPIGPPILAAAPLAENTTVITVPQQISLEPQMQQVQVIQTLSQEAAPPHPHFQPQPQPTTQIVQLSEPPPQGETIVHLQASNAHPGDIVHVSQPVQVQTIITQPQTIPQTLFTSPPPQQQQIIVSPPPQITQPTQQISIPQGPPPGHHQVVPPPPQGPPPVNQMPPSFAMPPNQPPPETPQQLNIPPPPIQQQQPQMNQSINFPPHSSGVFPQQTQVTVIHTNVAPPQLVTNPTNIHTQILQPPPNMPPQAPPPHASMPPQAPPLANMAPPTIVTSAPNIPPQIIQTMPPSQPHVVQVPSPVPQQIVNLQQPPPPLPPQQVTLPPGPPPPTSMPSFIQIQQAPTPPPQLVTSQQTVLISQPLPQVPVSQTDLGQRLVQPPAGLGEYGPGPTQVQTVGEYGPLPAAPPGMKTVMGEYGPVLVKEEPQPQSEYGFTDRTVTEFRNIKSEGMNEYGSVANVKSEYGFLKQENGESKKDSEKYDPFNTSESQESDYDPAVPTEGDSPGKMIVLP